MHDAIPTQADRDSEAESAEDADEVKPVLRRQPKRKLQHRGRQQHRGREGQREGQRGVRAEITLPRGLSGTFEWQGQRRSLREGRQIIRFE